MSNTRRFYFDDGSSRKRWHVRLNGKSQVVEFGRLGAALRESKKTFRTPDEARINTDKLIAAKKRAGYIEINPALLEIAKYKKSKVATESQIQSLEKQLGCRLPEEYRTFLSTRNGGRPNPPYVRIPGLQHIESVDVSEIFGLFGTSKTVYSIAWAIESRGGLLPPGHLPFAFGSDLFTISLRKKDFGCIHFWDHESDEVDCEDDEGQDRFLESASHLLAGSFDEFLTRIAVVFGVPEAESDESASAQTPAGKNLAGKKLAVKVTVKSLLRLLKNDHTPTVIKQIEQVVQELGDLSGIQNGEWPFRNIRNPDLLRWLLNAGLNPEIVDTDGHSLLWQCAGNRECIDFLAERGVKIDRRSGGDHETALMRAVYLADIPSVKRLLQLGANPTVRLDWPARDTLKTNSKLRKLVEKARAEWQKNGGSKHGVRVAPVEPTTSGFGSKKTPKPTIKRLLQLMTFDFITDEDEEVYELEQLIAALGDLSGIRDKQWPVIDKLESPRLLRCLLEAGLNPELTDKAGGSLLCQCVVHPECIDLLLKRGVAIDRRSGRHDHTALMRATYMGDEECVERLLAAGANPTLEFDSFSQTLLEMDEEMSAVIKAARNKWNRSHGSRKNAKKAIRKK